MSEGEHRNKSVCLYEAQGGQLERWFLGPGWSQLVIQCALAGCGGDVVFHLGVETRRAGKLEGYTLALVSSKFPNVPKLNDQDETRDPRRMADMRPASPRSGLLTLTLFA